MSTASEELLRTLEQAASPGLMKEPSALIAAIDSLDDPMATLADFDEANNLYDAFYADFGFIKLFRAANRPLSQANRDAWAELTRWLVDKIRGWRPAQDERGRALAAVFIVAQASDVDDQFWNRVPVDIVANTALIEHVKELLKSFFVNIQMPLGWRRGGAQHEVLEEFAKHDAAGDWVSIGEDLQAIADGLFPNTVQEQSVRVLYRAGADHLVDGIKDISRTGLATLIVDSLTTEESLTTAVAGNNPYVQFATVYRTAYGRVPRRELTANEQDLLTELFAKVTADEARWKGWMKVFNTYPVRFPTVQAPLGRALATASRASLESYVDSIWLYNQSVQPRIAMQGSGGRDNVGHCLRAFAAHASPEQRLLLWAHAHDRWRAWAFEQKDKNIHLFDANRCDLDYAVVAFAVEGMDGAARTARMDAIWERMRNLEHTWHQSITAMTTEWYRLLSEFQPYARASNIIDSGEDFITNTQYYLPFDPEENTYFSLRFRMSRR